MRLIRPLGYLPGEANSRKRNSKKTSICLFLVVLLFLALTSWGCRRIEDTQPEAAPDLQELTTRLQGFILQEMEMKQLPGISFALIDNQEIIWVAGFGNADPIQDLPARPETIYRMGSVSAILTMIAVLQPFGDSEFRLDEPVSKYLPSFKPENPFARKVTIDYLITNRSGLVQQPPAGHYFDPTEPSLEETVGSINRTAILFDPGSKAKNSSAGFTVLGYMIASMKNRPFAQHMQRSVFSPLGLQKSSFKRDESLDEDLIARGYMWTKDDEILEAPTFESGISPVSGLYSSTNDLAQLIRVLFNQGQGPRERVLKPWAVDMLWTPHSQGPGVAFGPGYGFNITPFERQRYVSHTGGHYGTSVHLGILPDIKLAAVAATNMGDSPAVVRRIAEYALRLVIAHKRQAPLPPIPGTIPVGPELSSSLIGSYQHEYRRIKLYSRDGRLFMQRPTDLFEIRSLANRLIADDRLHYGPEVKDNEGNLQIGERLYEKIAESPPSPVPNHWQGLLGTYGWEHAPLKIFAYEKSLVAQLGFHSYLPLKQISEDEYSFPTYSQFKDEKIAFERNPSGRATQAWAGGMLFKRLDK